MGLLTFIINVTLDGCVDHQEGIADNETHAFFTCLMDEGGAMLWGRVTYEMMEGYWPAVARGDEEAPPAMREWAVKLEAKPKYVVSSTSRGPTATTSPATCARACRSSRTRPRLACSSVAASSRPNWTGWI
jgi:dihydrofolate reductase